MRDEPPESRKRPERPFSTEAAEGSLRRGRLAAVAEKRACLETAALELAGEHGYRALTVQLIVEHTGISRAAFYDLFSDKAEVFASAYGAAATELEEALLAPCEETQSWVKGLRDALEVLAQILAARPAWACGVLGEAQVAGGAAGARRKEGFERLSRAIDRARREIGSSRHSPPPVTAAFILNGIETAALRNLRYRGGRDFRKAVPELLYFTVAPYWGTKAATVVYREARRR
jgi:AcrR family transcriptional regulator